ncbi:hypothetical protein RF11_03937 [Thelohanellus kitauei]|uniref:Uncharacterized protein n=1 Tax=Thelohanellus kitauei TaxID=669202 RepID=A0A0C2NIM6_THEKT|nr:hypothetical protein RF11_03937 [Thelohanellus kitauei]
MANRNLQAPQITTQQCVSQQIHTQQCVSKQIPTQQCGNQQIATQQCWNQQIATQQCGNQQIPIQQCVSQQIPTQQCVSQQIPTQQCVSQQISTQQYVSQQIPTQQFVSQQIPTQQRVSQQIPTQQYVVQQIQNPELVNYSVYPVEYLNNLQQHVQIPCNGYTNQTIDPNQVSVDDSPQISYQNMPVIHTNVYEQQSVDNNQTDDLYILIKKDDHYELLPVASWQRIIFNASLNANYQICHPELLERFLTDNGYSLLDNQLAALRQISESYQHSQSQS